MQSAAGPVGRGRARRGCVRSDATTRSWNPCRASVHSGWHLEGVGRRGEFSLTSGGVTGGFPQRAKRFTFRIMKKRSNARKDRAGRNERLRDALRENLKRRKAQAKARAAGSGAPDRAQHDSAGIAEDKDSG